MKTLSVRVTIPLVALLFAIFAAGCSGDTTALIPTEPSVVLQAPAPVPPPAASPQPVGRPIAVGEIVTASVSSDDASCHYLDPSEPEEGELAGDCQRFVIVVPGDGTLGVRVAWDHARDVFFLGVDSQLYACCATPLLARVQVRGGSSYTLDVVRTTVTVGGTRSMPFVLTTWLERN